MRFYICKFCNSVLPCYYINEHRKTCQSGVLCEQFSAITEKEYRKPNPKSKPIGSGVLTIMDKIYEENIARNDSLTLNEKKRQQYEMEIMYNDYIISQSINPRCCCGFCKGCSCCHPLGSCCPACCSSPCIII